MDEQLPVFDRLVLSLDATERQLILRQIAETSELQQTEQIQNQPPTDILTGVTQSPQEKLQEEPFWIRLWFAFRAFFSQSSSYQLYAAHLVVLLGRRLAKNWNVYIDVGQRRFTSGLADRLAELRKTQSFFSGLLSAYENEKGAFYIVLASLMMHDTAQTVASCANPFSVSYLEPVKPEMRASLLRKLESALSAIPDQDRARMYQAAQSIEWMKTFCDLPLDRVLLRFGSMPGDTRGCLAESVGAELQSIVNVLSGSKRIPILLLEALYLFSIQDRFDEKKTDIENECKVFVATASGYLSGIRDFKNAVPLADLARFAVQDVSWSPVPESGGEDWFLFYKTAWKKKFDEQWASWSKLHRSAMLEKRITAFLDGDRMPDLVNAPWKNMWIPLVLRREVSFRFIKGIFKKIYPQVLMKPLKILLIEGDFYRRENLIEYTDAFSNLEHMAQTVDLFEARLSAKGDLGEVFVLLQKEKVATVRGKTRLENLMLTTNSETDMIIGKAISSFRSIDAILGGILSVVRGGPYETLVNLASIQGRANDKYRKDLTVVRQRIQEACQILEEAEVIEREAF
jgi:hypothetical protein